ncbi:MAG: hypothetical protein QNJ97_01815 [Myxococcota bacterium]|nr:hypothetical protein [Myxococcota bacterium]
MRNVTISLPEDIVRWVKIRAAQNDTSMSKMLAQLIVEHKNNEEKYDIAMCDFLRERPLALNASKSPYPSRDERHDRNLLR